MKILQNHQSCTAVDMLFSLANLWVGVEYNFNPICATPSHFNGLLAITACLEPANIATVTGVAHELLPLSGYPQATVRTCL